MRYKVAIMITFQLRNEALDMRNKFAIMRKKSWFWEVMIMTNKVTIARYKVAIMTNKVAITVFFPELEKDFDRNSLIVTI